MAGPPGTLRRQSRWNRHRPLPPLRGRHLHLRQRQPLLLDRQPHLQQRHRLLLDQQPCLQQRPCLLLRPLVRGLPRCWLSALCTAARHGC